MSEQDIISRVLQVDHIFLDIEASAKEDCERLIAESFFRHGAIDSVDGFLAAVAERETLASTYCTMQIAIPHGISTIVKKPQLGFARLARELDWDNDGDSPVQYVFLIAMPAGEAAGGDNRHIELLSKIATMTLDEDFQKQWKSADSKQQIYELFKGYTE